MEFNNTKSGLFFGWFCLCFFLVIVRAKSISQHVVAKFILIDEIFFSLKHSLYLNLSFFITEPLLRWSDFGGKSSNTQSRSGWGRIFEES